MADIWDTPKQDWDANDAIGYDDLNRIESNASALRYGTYRRVQGFGYTVDNTVSGQDGVITVTPGSAFTNNGVPFRMTANHTKNLTTWVQGNGATFGGMAPGVTPAAWTWYYIYAIYNQTSGATEIMFDSDPAGGNVSSVTYTEKRWIGTFKTAAAGGDGSFDLCIAYSTGDTVFFDPNSFVPAAGYITITQANPTPLNTFELKTLTAPTVGLLLPPYEVTAKLNINTQEGAIALYNYHFPIPSQVRNGTVWYGEHSDRDFQASTPDRYAGDIDIIVSPAGQLYVGMWNTGAPATAYIRVRGFYQDRRF